jgi:hypothetical protein
MKCHGNTPVVIDGLDALMTYVTRDVIVVVDGNRWKSWGENLELPVYKLAGFPQGNTTSMYRNVTLALKNALEIWPDCDWYCSLDYDVLFASDAFKDDLKRAEENGVWCVGNDLRDYPNKFPYLESIIGEPINVSKYLIGCCVFYHRDFLNKLKSFNFFDRLLMMTNDFSGGFFPNCEDIFDFGEHLYPTLAAHYGGKLAQFAGWSDTLGHWYCGDFRKYPVRWRPDIALHEIAGKQTSIIHPLKEYDSDVRTYYREIRRRKNLANLQ